MSIEKQKKDIEVLLQLIKENPDIEILPMVATECSVEYSHAYWMSRWSKAELDKYWVSSERMYSYNEDFDRLVDDWIDDNYQDYEDLTDGELRILAEKTINNYEWTEAIIVYIEPL